MMTKTPLPLRIEDMTLFTRALSRQLGDNAPSHLTLMNMLARASGFQNVQHMRASHAAAIRLRDMSEDRVSDARSVERTLHQFDDLGRLIRWPSKRSIQSLALWALWARLPRGIPLHEKAINEVFMQEHLFHDPATLRRTMIACGLLTRQRDGTDYRRVEQKPPAEARAVIEKLSARRRVRPASDPACESA